MKFYLYTIVTAMSLTLFSCDDFVSVDLPDSQLTGVTVFEDRTTLNAAMADVYAKLRDSGILGGSLTGGSVNYGLYADELDYYGPAGGSLERVSQNTLVPTDAYITQMWNTTFNQVYAANAILYGIENSETLAVPVREQYTGEALFVRAITHFYLANLFGDIPYITSTDYRQNQVATRQPHEEVYGNITEDLLRAVALLPDAYPTAERVRPNKSTARALLARTYLYRGMWQLAEEQASLVIQDSQYTWDTNIENTFKKQSTTTLWQLQPRIAGANTEEGNSFIFTSGPPPRLALTQGLVDAFADNDLRKAYWIKAVTNGTDTWYHANKYTQPYGPSTSTEYPIVLRLAEQYLIRAEARAHLGNLSTALEDLNRIRNRAGINALALTDQATILEAILAERRLELFTEHGHRLFDLKRTQTINLVLAQKPGYDPHDTLWPLPANELIANPNLAPQNPGY